MFIQEDSPSAAAAAAAAVAHDPFSSYRDVTYSCGSCGYALNLSSSNRNTTNISSKYGKDIKKGIISFFCIDESRFSQSDELKCIPYFISKHSWGLFRKRTKLHCRKCGNHIGNAFEENAYSIGSGNSESSSGNGASVCKKYKIKISSLQPSADESGIPLFS